MNKMRKFGGHEKYDSFVPNKRQFTQDEWMTSRCIKKFHNTTFGFADNHHISRYCGVNKKLYKVSGSGILIDQYSIGLSDKTD